MCPEDTSPEAWKILLDLERRMPPGRKLGLALEHSRLLRSLALAGLRRRYPQENQRQIFLRLARETLGPELFERVYGEPA
jgi:hypothetical protein